MNELFLNSTILDTDCYIYGNEFQPVVYSVISFYTAFESVIRPYKLAFSQF